MHPRVGILGSLIHCFIGTNLKPDTRKRDGAAWGLGLFKNPYILPEVYADKHPQTEGYLPNSDPAENANIFLQSMPPRYSPRPQSRWTPLPLAHSPLRRSLLGLPISPLAPQATQQLFSVPF